MTLFVQRLRGTFAEAAKVWTFSKASSSSWAASVCGVYVRRMWKVFVNLLRGPFPLTDRFRGPISWTDIAERLRGAFFACVERFSGSSILVKLSLETVMVVVERMVVERSWTDYISNTAVQEQYVIADKEVPLGRFSFFQPVVNVKAFVRVRHDHGRKKQQKQPSSVYLTAFTL